MRSGQLRHRVVLQRGTAVHDAFGQETQTWTALGTVWGAVEPLAGREYLEARQQQTDLSTRIRIRHHASMGAADRVTWTDTDDVAHIFDVKTIIDDPTHLREMTLMCVEVTA